MPKATPQHRRYVPILKTKAGERWAIENLRAATKSQVTPLFEIHTHKTKDTDDHVAQICEDSGICLGEFERPFYLDTAWLHGDAGDATVIGAVFESARASGLLAVPVARMSWGPMSREQLARRNCRRG